MNTQEPQAQEWRAHRVGRRWPTITNGEYDLSPDGAADMLNALESTIADLRRELAEARAETKWKSDCMLSEQRRAEAAEASLDTWRQRALDAEAKLSVATKRRSLLCKLAQEGKLRGPAEVKAALWYGDEAFLAALTPAAQAGD